MYGIQPGTAVLKLDHILVYSGEPSAPTLTLALREVVSAAAASDEGFQHTVAATMGTLSLLLSLANNKAVCLTFGCTVRWQRCSAGWVHLPARPAWVYPA